MSIAGAGAGAGFGAALWSPDRIVQSGDSWLYVDLDAPGAITRATQISNTNSDFSVWTGVNPDATPTGWSKVPATGTSANHIEAAGNACRLVSDGTLTLVYKNCTIGTRVLYNGNVTALPDPTLYEYNDVKSIGSTGLFSIEATPATNIVGIKRAGGTGTVDGTFTDLVFTVLSVTSVTCKGVLGNLTQATAANMPWSSDASAPTSLPINGRGVLYFDGSADRIVSSLAASNFTFMSNGNPAMWAAVIKPASTAANAAVMSAFSGTAGDYGFLLRVNAGGAVRFAIGKGGGLYALDITSASTLSAGTTYVLSGAYAGAGAYTVRSNGIEIASGTPSGIVSNAPSGTLAVGSLAAGSAVNPWNGSIGQVFLVNRYDLSSLSQLEKYLGGLYGVTI